MRISDGACENPRSAPDTSTARIVSATTTADRKVIARLLGVECGRRYQRARRQVNHRGDGMARLELGRTEKHNRWNRDLPPRAQAANGDVIVFHTTSADDDPIDPERPTFVGYDRTRVHPLTGPVYVRDAEPGDVLDVEVLAVVQDEWGRAVTSRPPSHPRDC